MSGKATQGTQVRDKPCPWLCDYIPKNVPSPGPAQTVLHPRKDVFVLKLPVHVGRARTIHANQTAQNGEGNHREETGEGNHRIKTSKTCDIYQPGGVLPNCILPQTQVALCSQIAKVGPTGDRRCKMELELVTPKFAEKKPLCRIDTRETQCDPDPPPCCCYKPRRAKAKKQ